MPLAVTLACRLQICHTCWVLHWHIVTVGANTLDSYTGLWITNLPYPLDVTLVYDQCRSQCLWLLHQLVDYKSALPVGYYIDVWSM